MKKIIKQFLKLKLLIITNIIFCNIFLNNAHGSENFIVTTVNKIPITKRDVVMNKNSIWGDSITPYIMPEERSPSIDSIIDLIIRPMN